MATLAGRREIRRGVVWICRFLVIGQMARSACRGQPFKLSHGRALVAVLALHRRMCSKQGKAVLVILDLRDGNLPAQHRVALRAIRSEFPPVNVRVAIRAISPHVREHRLRVALRALHFLVHSAQRVVRLVMVEFRYFPDRPPRHRRVAVLARNGQ